MGMFDIGDKSETLRIAMARAIVKVRPETIRLIKEGKSPKGNIVDADQNLWNDGSQANMGFIAILPPYTNRSH